MQNKYAGDVGDFGKFSLLRHLTDNTTRVGVVWYLFPDELRSQDGHFTNFLSDPGFHACDSSLCEKLATAIDGQRSVSALEKAGLLPSNTEYFSAKLDFHLQHTSQSKRDKKEREEKRKQWLEDAVRAVSDCNLIFLDPDNGLQIPSCPKIGQIKSGKFAYYEEIYRFSIGKDVTVVYHHLGRKGTHQNQILSRAAELRKYINPTGTIFALRYKPYSPRAFFLLSSKLTENKLGAILHSFLQSINNNYWDSYYQETFE